MKASIKNIISTRDNYEETDSILCFVLYKLVAVASIMASSLSSI